MLAKCCCVLITIILCVNRIFSLDIGEACALKELKKPATCQLVYNCEYAIRLITEEFKHPTHCGWGEGNEEVVCCPEEDSPHAFGPLAREFGDAPDGILVAGNLKCRYEGSFPFYCCEMQTEAPRPEPRGCPPLPDRSRDAPPPHADQTGLSTFLWNKCVSYGRHAEPCVLEGGQLRRAACTIPNTDFRVSGGSPSYPREFPHMALLGYRIGTQTEWSAGGSLISERYILTAGHVLNSVTHGHVRYARLGFHKRGDHTGLIFNVEKRTFFAEYSPKTKRHDLALLRLDRRVPLSPDIRPICLPYPGIQLDSARVVTGWGGLGDGLGYSEELRKASVVELDERRCRDGGDVDFDGQYMICAGAGAAYGHRNDTCQGDSGGPLQAYFEAAGCQYALLGVTSKGPSCGQGGAAVYTKLLSVPYLRWIVRVVWPEAHFFMIK